MLNDRYVFSQLMDFLPKHEFHRCVARYQGNQRNWIPQQSTYV